MSKWKWIWRAIALTVFVVYLVSSDLRPGPVDDFLLGLIEYLIDRVFFQRGPPSVPSGPSPPPLPAATEEVERLQREVGGLKAEVRRLRKGLEGGIGKLEIAIALLTAFFLWFVFWPMGKLEVETATTLITEVPMVPHPVESMAQRGEMVPSSEVEGWFKQEGVRRDYFLAAYRASLVCRDKKTRVADPDGKDCVFVDPFTIYQGTWGAENLAGWEKETPDPRKPGTWGKSLAKPAIEGWFRKFGKAEVEAQLGGLKKVVGQKCLQERYPGLTVDNVYGGVAGELGVPQGTSKNEGNLMADWISKESPECFDPWGDPDSMAEFTARYMAPNAPDRWNMVRSYNPGEPSTVTRSRRFEPAELLEASWKRTFGDSRIQDLIQPTTVQAAAQQVQPQAQQVYVVQTPVSLEDKVAQLLFCGPDAIGTGICGNFVFTGEDAQTDEQFRFQADRAQRDLTGRGKPEPFLAVDQEGGNFSRVGTQTPSAKEVAEKGLDVAAWATEHAQQLKAAGLNTNLAPVADVFVPGLTSTIIGDRSFGSDPQTVATLVASYVETQRKLGIINATKHWPGHGCVSEDTHHALGACKKSLASLRSAEFVPFEAAFKAGVPMVMVGHIAVPAVDGDVPTSQSAKLLATLRQATGNNVVIVTDEIGSMAAAGEPVQAAVRAFAAGADMVIIRRNALKTPQLYSSIRDAVVEAVQAGQISESEIDRKVARIKAVKRQFGLRVPEEAPRVQTQVTWPSVPPAQPQAAATTRTIYQPSGVINDTPLLRLLRWSREREKSLEQALETIKRGGQLTSILGGDALARELGNLIDPFYRAARQIHRASRWLATLVYPPKVLAAAGEPATEITQLQQKGPQSGDIVSDLDLATRPDQAHVANILTVLAGSIGLTPQAEMQGAISVPARGSWSFTQGFRPFTYSLVQTLAPDPGVSDLATAFAHLGLRTPGLQVAAWRSPVPVVGFPADEAVDLSRIRGTDLVVSNTTERPISVFWRLSVNKLQIWVPQMAAPGPAVAPSLPGSTQGLSLLPQPNVWVDPIPGMRATQKFGVWVEYMEDNTHWGVDYSITEGDSIVAPLPCIVDYVGWYPQGWGPGTGRGEVVFCRLGQLADGRAVWFIPGHMSEQSVTQGELVRAGQELGKAGHSGYVKSGGHTHIEIRVGGGPQYKGPDTLGRRWEDGEFQDPEVWFAWLSGKSTEPPVSVELLQLVPTGQPTPSPAPPVVPTPVIPTQLAGFASPVDTFTPEQFLTWDAYVSPGEQRAYRCGIHQSWDVGQRRGLEVKTVKDGVVIRSDEDYKEMTKAEREAVKTAACAIGQPSLSMSENYAQAADKLFGRQVWIQHPDGTISKYSHLLDVTVQVGQQVQQGQLIVIGHVGSSGTDTLGQPGGDHLDFTIFLPDGSVLGQKEYEVGGQDALRRVWYEAFK